MGYAMRVLIITKIFPNRHNGSYASYNRHQFRELSRLCDVQLFALWPQYPGRATVERWRGGADAQVPPASDTIDGMYVEHPRVWYLPRVGAPLAGVSYLLSLLPRVWSRRHDIDVVMGSFAYPDGFAAVGLARLLGKPAVIKLHGSDVNVVSERRLLRPGLRYALSGARRVVANNRKILTKAIAFGAAADSVRWVPNGIDGDVFFARDKREARARLKLPLEGKRILYVGRMVATKGLWELLDAMAVLAGEEPAVHLDMVGTGALVGELAAAAKERALAVTFYGDQPAERVAQHIAAADVVTLPSYAEGMPNTVVEALACGRPVVATDVGGVPTLLKEPCQGELVAPRDAELLAAALARVVANNYPAEQVTSASTSITWKESAAALHRVIVEASL